MDIKQAADVSPDTSAALFSVCLIGFKPGQKLPAGEGIGIFHHPVDGKLLQQLFALPEYIGHEAFKLREWPEFGRFEAHSDF